MGEKGWEVGWAWMVSSKSLRSLSHQGKHSMNHGGSLMGTSRHFIPRLFRSLSLVSATPSAWPLELFWFSLFPPFSCLCGQHRAMARALKEAEHRVWAQEAADLSGLFSHLTLTHAASREAGWRSSPEYGLWGPTELCSNPSPVTVGYESLTTLGFSFLICRMGVKYLHHGCVD